MASPSEKHCDVSYKILVLGETSVGKTALINCLMGRQFQMSMISTIGIDFVKKTFEVDNALIELLVWDTAGQEKFRSITKMYYRGAQGIVLVYDITNPASFLHLSYWMNTINYEISHAHNHLEPIPIVLVGNKKDLEGKRKIPAHTGEKLATKEMAFEFFETSAMTGENVELLFQRLAYHITDICNPKLMSGYHPKSICNPDSKREKPEVRAARSEHRGNTSSGSGEREKPEVRAAGSKLRGNTASGSSKQTKRKKCCQFH